MPAPTNPFKQALAERRLQLGLWAALASPIATEVSAGAGFDWLVIDGEHAPNDIPLLTAQLQAVAASPSHPVVRVPVGDAALIKQVLDIGAQTVLVPMVETAAQAEALVRATRYPPQGIRGVGAALGRASAYSRIPDYLETANDQICLLVQVESAAGLAAIERIAAVAGVDGIFIGPADLAADLGCLGNPGAPEVVAAIEDGLARIQAAGQPAGILHTDPAQARRYVELGATFVAVGADVLLLAAATSRLRREFAGGTAPVGGAGY